MSRFLGLGIAAVLLGVAVLAYSSMGNASAQSAEADPTGMEYHMGILPPDLAFLRNVPRDQRFQYFHGATMTFVNQQGTQITVNLIPGTVKGVTSNSVTITPNGQTTERSFSITGDTSVIAQPSPGSLQVLVPGDQVVVVNEDQSQNATAIVKYPSGATQVQPGTSSPAPSATPAPTSAPGS